MAQQSANVPPESRDELAELRTRVAELERELAAQRKRKLPDEHAEFRDTLYEALLYGLARTLALYDPASVRLLVREMGRRIREYLEEVGYHVGSGETIDEVIEQTMAFFTSHGFVDLQLVSWNDDLIRARWHRLFGLRAYERIVAAGAETFVSCPLNAIIHDALEAFGKELALVRKEFHLDEGYVESWEQIVDLPDGTPPQRLSLNAERLLELEREQSRQLRVRDDFIRIASHELATPLTSTKLALRRLESTPLPDREAKSVAVLKRQVHRLEHLVTEMLDMTRLQIGRVKMQRASIDLVRLTRTVIESLGAEQRSDVGEIRLTGDASVVGTWDSARLDQVLSNLLGNAIKYGAGRPIEVDITAGEGRGRISVRDQGIGISTEAMTRLFKPFERGVSVEHYGGLGLGLYITRRIVEMHGGTISVKSEVDKGTTFTVVLPLECERDAALLVGLPLSGHQKAS